MSFKMIFFVPSMGNVSSTTLYGLASFVVIAVGIAILIYGQRLLKWARDWLHRRTVWQQYKKMALEDLLAMEEAGPWPPVPLPTAPPEAEVVTPRPTAPPLSLFRALSEESLRSATVVEVANEMVGAPSRRGKRKGGTPKRNTPKRAENPGDRRSQIGSQRRSLYEDPEPGPSRRAEDPYLNPVAGPSRPLTLRDLLDAVPLDQGLSSEDEAAFQVEEELPDIDDTELMPPPPAYDSDVDTGGGRTRTWKKDKRGGKKSSNRGAAAAVEETAEVAQPENDDEGGSTTTDSSVADDTELAAEEEPQKPRGRGRPKGGGGRGRRRGKHKGDIGRKSRNSRKCKTYATGNREVVNERKAEGMRLRRSDQQRREEEQAEDTARRAHRRQSQGALEWDREVVREVRRNLPRTHRAAAATNVHQFVEAEDFRLADGDVGNMDHPCPHCDALLFPRELKRAGRGASRMTPCCGGGKVALAPYEDPPQPLYDLINRQGDKQGEFLKRICR